MNNQKELEKVLWQYLLSTGGLTQRGYDERVPCRIESKCFSNFARHILDKARLDTSEIESIANNEILLYNTIKKKELGDKRYTYGYYIAKALSSHARSIIKWN